MRLSPKGLSNSELQQILGLDPHSSLAQCKQLPGVRRENHKRPVVYFSADDEVYRQQQHTRYPPQPTTPRLSPDALTIIILVALIQHPSSTAEELSEMLKREGLVVDQPMIEELLAHHGLMKKKLNTPE